MIMNIWLDYEPDMMKYDMIRWYVMNMHNWTKLECDNPWLRYEKYFQDKHDNYMTNMILVYECWSICLRNDGMK